MTLACSIIVAFCTAWYAADNHRSTDIQVQRYDDDAFVKKVNQAISDNETLKRIDRAADVLDKRISVLEQWKKDFLDPNMRKLRIDQKSIKRGQDEIRRQLETDEAFI